MARVLIIDDEENILKTLSGILASEGLEPITAATGSDGLERASDTPVDCVLLDVWLPDIDGLQVLRELKRNDPVRPVIMMSGHSTIATAVDATKLGAYTFLEKPLDLERLLLTLRNALQLHDLERENILLKEGAEDAPVMIGTSTVLDRLRALVAQVAPTNSRILITGENGTGKEIVARAIYTGSERFGKPFIKVNCAAIPGELIESELFGHEKGAFTGATAAKPGKFELADGGTIFLDEIGDMSPGAQAKVLRVLEEQELERVGGKKPVKVDVRAIAATNQDLEALIEEGEFRQDLYFRLNVIPIHVPPLREHPDDIPLIAEHFLAKYSMENSKRPKQITRDAVNILKSYQWPGNVRELRNFMERLAILTPGDEITPADLAGIIPGIERPYPVPQAGPDGSDDMFIGRFDRTALKDAISTCERELIERRLTSCKGNVKRTAEELGLERSHLYKKMRSLGIDPSKRNPN
ncbi:sigma-54-dependent Fis family transcriptional regulator [bacterium]|nr:sigma-54-dependent Fis family transcriptional regulator [bacterium]